MGNMNKNIVTIIIAMFALTGCGTSQNGNYIIPQQINNPELSEIAPVFETQVERVNNCDGTNPFYNISYKTIEAQRASFEVTVGAGGLVTGTPVPSALEVQLEAKITAALAKEYGLTTEKNHDLTLNNVEGSFLEHTITWKVTRVKGIIEVIYGDGTAQVGFEKIADVELYDRTSKSIGCNGQSANSSPSATPAIVLATEAPTMVIQNSTSSVSENSIPCSLQFLAYKDTRSSSALTSGFQASIGHNDDGSVKIFLSGQGETYRNYYTLSGNCTTDEKIALLKNEFQYIEDNTRQYVPSFTLQEPVIVP